jgi:DDE superfamily endonuclease
MTQAELPRLRAENLDHSGIVVGSTDLNEILREFREAFYACMRRRSDALFELSDAILTAGNVQSPAHLSLEGVHRRGWGSVYAALSKGRIDAEAFRGLLASREASRDPGAEETLVYVVDVSAWPRCDAEASPGRGYLYHPSRHSAGQPIVAGWAYQLVARLGFERDSWVTPMDERRVEPEEDSGKVAAEQVKSLLRRLPARASSPLFVFDAGYDPVRLQLYLEGCCVQLLVRLNSGRVFYADPEPLSRRPVGRPYRHGKKFDLKDPETWPEPTREHRCVTNDYGSVRVRAWSGLHPKTRRAKERYGSESAAVVRGTVVLVEVGRLPRGERRRKPKALWLWWHGEGEPDLELLWKSYCRRFSVEHAIRFLKQALGWTAPRVRHPEQADRWTWLVLAVYTQLCLARGVVADRRLPWERPLPPQKLTPTRVLRSFVTLLPTLGTPAEAPKPRGRSPGRPKGSRSGRARRHPALKKAS